MACADIFCNVPWFHLQVDQDGSFAYCCNQTSATPKSGYNIQTHTIRQWFHSDEMKKFRQDVRGSHRVGVCESCYLGEQNQDESYRITQNWRSIIFTKDAFDASYQQSPHYSMFETEDYRGMPIEMHIDLGNECNLSCKFCDPAISTQVAAKYRSWGLIDHNQPLHRTWTRNDDVWNRFCKELLTIPNLQSVHFMGGEPMLSPRLEQFFDFFIQAGRTDFAVSFVTNGTRYSQSIIDKMRKFTRADIDISIESPFANNFYMRQGLDPELYRTNLDRFLGQRGGNFNICLKPVICALTVPTFPDLIEFFWKNRCPTENNLCLEPRFMQVSVLPIELRRIYMPRYENLLARLSDAAGPAEINQARNDQQLELGLWTELNFMYQLLQAPVLEDCSEQQLALVEHLARWDREFGMDARDHYPEWAEFLNHYCYAQKLQN